jgi:hypothetical protein
MKPMDQQYIEKHDIAHRYLHGRLTPEETQEFEVYLMDNPEMVEVLEVDQLLTVELEQTDLQPVSQSKKFSLLNMLFGSPSGASLVTFGCCALLFVLLPQTTTLVGTDLSQPTDLVSLSETRSGSGSIDAVISLSENTSTVILIIQTKYSENGIYNVTVRGQTSDSLITNGQFNANSKGELFVPLDMHKMHPGLITIEYMQHSKPATKRSYQLSIEQ